MSYTSYKRKGKFDIKKRIFDHYEIYSDGYIIDLKTNKKMVGNRNIHNPYLKINLVDQGKKRTFLMHKLLIMSFIDKYDERIHVIQFKDGNISNCTLGNLEIGTVKWHGYDKVIYIEPIILVDTPE